MLLLHSSITPINEVLSIKPREVNYIKPKGLWYAPGKVWLKYSKGFHPQPFYLYILVPVYTNLKNPDRNKILKIKSAEELDELTFKYGYVDVEIGLNLINLNWKKLAEEYAGLEIIPFIKERGDVLKLKTNVELKNKYLEKGFDLSKNMFWYEMWNIPCGCVWNKKAIEDFYLVTKIKGKLDISKIKLKKK